MTTATEMKTIVTDKQASALQDATVAVQLTFRAPSCRVAIKGKHDVVRESVETGSDMSMLHISKDLWVSSEFSRIVRHRHAVKAEVFKRALPVDIFRGGVYLVPLAIVNEIDSFLDNAKKEDTMWTEAFLSAYVGPSGLVAQARQRLGPLFDEEDYPKQSKLRKAFGFDVMYHEFRTPEEKLATLSFEMLQREREKARVHWENVTANVVDGLRAELRDVIGKCLKAITPRSDGKKKVFKAVNLERLQAFLSLIGQRNVLGDPELERLSQDARALIRGVVPDQLNAKGDDGFKDSMRGSLASIHERLVALVGDAPMRKFDFSEEGETDA